MTDNSKTNNSNDKTSNTEQAVSLFADKAFAKQANAEQATQKKVNNGSTADEATVQVGIPADTDASKTNTANKISTQKTAQQTDSASGEQTHVATAIAATSSINAPATSSPDSTITSTNTNPATDVEQSESTNKVAFKPSTLADGQPLKLAVVGHTNTGKTSILRTLLRDKYFGEVKNAPATTRHVERAVISHSETEQALVSLFDTPGLEDASGVMDWLEDNTASRRDGIERLEQFLANVPTMDEDYSQEAKVIKQLLGSDMAIYVVDAREPVLARYKDELTILSWAAIPIMPVFNFINTHDTHIKDWQTMLARRNLHVATQFDSVAFEFEDEIKLWDNLATMLTDANILEQLISMRQANWATLYEESSVIIADFLLNVSSFVKEIDEEDDPLPTLNEMQQAVRQGERNMQQQLLNLYKFYDNEVAVTPLVLQEYQQDPFDSEVLKNYGIRTTSGAAAGALVGMGIDAAALGVTLGLGTALGSLAGGLLSNTGKIADMITGVKHLYIDPATITLLATRSLVLLNTLRHRGHAATNQQITPQQITPQQATEQSTHPDQDKESDEQHADKDKQNKQNAIAPITPPWSADKLPSLLKKARNKAHWSSLAGANSEHTKELRKDAAWALSAKLREE